MTKYVTVQDKNFLILFTMPGGHNFGFADFQFITAYKRSAVCGNAPDRELLPARQDYTVCPALQAALICIPVSAGKATLARGYENPEKFILL